MIHDAAALHRLEFHIYQEITATIQSPSGNAVQYLSVRVHLWGESCVIAQNGVHHVCTVHPCPLSPPLYRQLPSAVNKPPVNCQPVPFSP